MKGPLKLPKRVLVTRLPSWKTFWNGQNRKIVKTCALVVVPMLTVTVAMILIVFTTQIDPQACPDPDLCRFTNQTAQPGKGTLFMTVSVGRLTFISSLSATLAGLLVAAQMTLFSHVMATRVRSGSTSSEADDSPLDAHSASLLIRFLNAEIPLLWDLYIRKIASLVKNQTPRKYPRSVRFGFHMLLVSLLGSFLVQGGNIYFHASIEATELIRRYAQPQQEHSYSRALALWCYDTSDTFGTMTNKNFWSCAVNAEYSGAIGRLPYLSSARFGAQEEVNLGYQQYLNNFTDTHGITYALIAASGTNSTVDWTGRSYAVSTACRAIPPSLCIWDPAPEKFYASEEPQWPFDCSSTHRGLFGNITYYQHISRLEDYHEFLFERLPFNNRKYPPPMMEKYIPLVKNTTVSPFINPFTFVSQLLISPDDDGKISEALEESDLPWKWRWKSPSGLDEGSTKFIFACNASVWDVEYTMSDGKVRALTPRASNGTVTGAVSMMASGFSDPFRSKMNEMYRMVNNNRSTVTAEEVTKRYEFEMSKAFISSLIANTVAVPVDLVQLRKSEIITRLPAVAPWVLVSVNTLFVLLAISLAVWGTKLSSAEAHQVQLRLSSAGLAAQLFSHQTSTLAVTDDFELFHDEKNIIEGEEERVPLVAICGSADGGAEFMVQSTDKEAGNSEREQYSFSAQSAPHLTNRATL